MRWSKVLPENSECRHDEAGIWRGYFDSFTRERETHKFDHRIKAVKGSMAAIKTIKAKHSQILKLNSFRKDRKRPASETIAS